MISLNWGIIIFLLVIPVLAEGDKNADKVTVSAIIILYSIQQC
jgi:hypothetical protein